MGLFKAPRKQRIFSEFAFGNNCSFASDQNQLITKQGKFCQYFGPRFPLVSFFPTPTPKVCYSFVFIHIIIFLLLLQKKNQLQLNLRLVSQVRHKMQNIFFLLIFVVCCCCRLCFNKTLQHFVVCQQQYIQTFCTNISTKQYFLFFFGFFCSFYHDLFQFFCQKKSSK